MVRKFDDKLRDLVDQSRKDRLDYNNKLGTLKSDISIVTFEKSTFNFIKDKVCLEWNSEA